MRFRRVGYQRMLVVRSQVNLYYFWEKRWFFLAMAIGALLLSLPGPEGLSRDGYIVLVMSVVATILFITEPIPLPTVALLIIAGQVLLLNLDSTKVAKSLMTDSVLFIMGSLMLAVAVVKQKLDKRIAWFIVQMTGTKTINICFGITVVSGLLASFVGEHTVAAMMLPVGITLITLTSDDPKRVRNLAAVLLFSICYGCSVAGIGTPSGGARNAIMIGYWREFLYDPSSPETRKYLMDYWHWMTYAYPLFLAQLPFVTLILYTTFKPEYKDLSRAVTKLRTQVMMEGPLKPSDWLAIFFFVMILIGWIVESEVWGMGIVAILGAAAFLIAGLVRWEELNSGVNWGVVLLVRGRHLAWRRNEGHRRRRVDRAELPVDSLAARGRQRPGALGRGLRADDRRHQHHVERRGGRGARADRAQDGDRRPGKPDSARVHHRGFFGLRLPHRGRHACLHHCLRIGLPQDHRLPQGRLAHGDRIDIASPGIRHALLAAAGGMSGVQHGP